MRGNKFKKRKILKQLIADYYKIDVRNVDQELIRIYREEHKNYQQQIKMQGIDQPIDINKSKGLSKDKRLDRKFKNVLKKFNARCGAVERYFDPSLRKE